MTPEKQRIAIAEACGWINVHSRAGTVMGYKSNSENGIVPDYLNDLNAMNQAENVLKDVDEYMAQLWMSVGFSHEEILTPEHLPRLCLATAIQRAEAFLKSLGLWED